MFTGKRGLPTRKLHAGSLKTTMVCFFKCTTCILRLSGMYRCVQQMARGIYFSYARAGTCLLRPCLFVRTYDCVAVAGTRDRVVQNDRFMSGSDDLWQTLVREANVRAWGLSGNPATPTLAQLSLAKVRTFVAVTVIDVCTYLRGMLDHMLHTAWTCPPPLLCVWCLRF